MPLKALGLPPTPRTLWETVTRLQREFMEFRAQRTLEAASIGSGGLTVQAPGDPGSIYLTPRGAVEILPYAGGPSHPPALEFPSGDPDETAPGTVLAYLEDLSGSAIPTLIAMTPNIGNGTAKIQLQAGVPDVLPAVIQTEVGDGIMIMDEGQATWDFAGGTSVYMNSSGLGFVDEDWTALTMSNGWTATGGTWLVPQFRLQALNTLQLLGSATPGTLTSGTVIATLPDPEYYPGGDVEYRVPGGSATAYADLVIHASTGQITITNVAGTITRISLSGICYGL